jgi:hypothetical protein
MDKCVRCEKSDQEVPLLQMRFQGRSVFICPQCLPVLIHKPAELKDELPGVEKIKPPTHEQ